MKYKGKYSIGGMSRLCNISRKALRYYDKIGLITPERQDYNNYRYYNSESLLATPVIKYYKQMGFTLDEMRVFIEGKAPNIYRAIQHSFLSKIEELEKEQEDISRKYASIKDWYNLILESEMVIDNNIQDVSIKYVAPLELIYQEQVYEGDIKASIINIEFTNYIEHIGNAIAGPVIINFCSYKDRMQNKTQNIRIMQKTLQPCPEETKMIFGGHMMATCYHIGPHDQLPETYKKISSWAGKQGYIMGEESYERYVTDYWTTRNDAQFVTEVMLKLFRQGAAV